MKTVDWNDIVGKTVESVDTKSANVVDLTFTDGTMLTVDTEMVLSCGVYAPVLYPTE